jgi:hypothetical protein
MTRKDTNLRTLIIVFPIVKPTEEKWLLQTVYHKPERGVPKATAFFAPLGRGDIK